ncbi:MAG: putative toxin-antitoxin system toxin component, PIN family [Chthoniobacterales bacterium]
MRVVLDTSVLVAAARSRRGASFALISMVHSRKFEPCLSVALYTEWQSALSRPENIPPGDTVADARAFLRYVAAACLQQEIYFLWRPYLPDPCDDHVLELAFASGSPYIVTHNIADFRGSEKLGIRAIAPRDFLAMLTKEP